MISPELKNKKRELIKLLSVKDQLEKQLSRLLFEKEKQKHRADEAESLAKKYKKKYLQTFDIEDNNDIDIQISERRNRRR